MSKLRDELEAVAETAITEKMSGGDTDLRDVLEIRGRSLAVQAMDSHIEAHVKNQRVGSFLSSVAGAAIMGEKPRKRDILGLALSALLSKKGSW